MSDTEQPEAQAAGQHFDVYFSYNSRDRALVEPIAARLKRAGLEPWLDRWALTPGGDWQRELGAGLDACRACAVFIGAHDIGAWELQEVTVAIDRATTQGGFRVFPVLLPGVEEPFDPNRLPHFLRARTWVDFRDGRDDRKALQHLVNAVKGVPFGPDVAVVRGDDVAPYRGLRVFGEEDARFFFGRDREVQRLLEKLKSNAFLAVLGPSGSGKSSLVRAGLVPELRAGALALDASWHVCVLRPGAAPLTALAAQLVELRAGEGMAATLDALGRDPRTLHLSVELALADSPPGERVLVIVDQLEEVFTLCNDESQRRQLFATLLDATSAPGGRTVVIVTMRADFYARCAAYPEFAQLVTAQQMLIGPIDADGLRQAIEEPARRVGLELEAGLSDTILADVAAEPGALPLLEHALLELWERRRGELLTLEGYREAGGVHGALAQRADQIFDGLSPAQREIARRALLRLTQPGEGTEDTRRRATRRELAAAEGDASFDVVLGRLVDARMLTTGRDETGQDVVDVSHEALIRGWPRMRRWIDADRAGLLVHRRLTDAARDWDTLGREPAAFYRGARLAIAREWAAEHGDDLSPLEHEFLAASHDAELRETEAAMRRSRRLRVLAGGLAALTVAIAVLAGWALHERGRAQRQTTAAASLALAYSATPLLDSRPDLSLLLGYAAYRTNPTAQARSSVLAALTTIRETGVSAILHGNAGPVFGVAFDPANGMLASAGSDGTLRLWDAATHRQLGPSLIGDGLPVYALAFSPDGAVLATASIDGRIQLWDVATRKKLGAPLFGDSQPVFGVAFGPHDTLAAGSLDGQIRVWDLARHKLLGRAMSVNDGMAVSDVAFAPDGTLVAADLDGSVWLWNVATDTRLGGPLPGSSTSFTSLAFAPDGTLAAGSGDGSVHLWNFASRTLIARLVAGTSGGVYSVAFSRDGRTLAAGSADGTVRMWNAATRQSIGQPLTGQTNVAYSIAFSPDGSTLASGSLDDTIRLWGVAARDPLAATIATDTGTVEAVAWAPRGETVAWGSADGAVRLLDAGTGKLLGPPLTGSGAAIYALAFSPDGKTLASAGMDDTIRLWNARTGGLLARLTGQTGGINGLAFNPRSGILASAASDGTVWLWNVKSGVRVARLVISSAPATMAPVNAVAFSPNGEVLAAGGDDNLVHLWSTTTDRSIGRLTGNANAVLALAFSLDGRTLASAGEDNTVRLWDVATDTQIHELDGPKAPAYSLAFSPDGQTLASASGDGTVRVWDLATGTALGVPLTGAAVNSSDAGNLSFPSVAFSPDGRTLVAAGAGNTIRRWSDVLWRTPAQLEPAVCGLLSGGLSRAEWARYAVGVSYRATCP
jgi:WD40 repeat protein